MKQKLITFVAVLGVFFIGYSSVFGDSGIPYVSSISYGNRSTQETGMWYIIFGKNLARKKTNNSFRHDMFISYATPYTDDESDPKSCDDAKGEKKFPRDDYSQKNPLKSNESRAYVVDVLDSYGNMNMSFFDSVKAEEGRKVRFCVYDLSDNVIFDRIISTDFKNCLKDLQKEGGIKFEGVSSKIDNAHTTLVLDTKSCKSMPLSVSFYSEKKAEALAGDGIIASITGFIAPEFGIALISKSVVDKLGTLLPLHLSINGNKEDYIELVPEKDKVKVSIKLSDQGCFTGQDPDCLIWTKVALPSDGAIATTAGFLGEEYKKAQTQGDNYKIANAYKKGVIMSECSGATGCSSFPSPWEIIKVTGAKTSYGKTLEVGVNQANYDKNSPCYSSELGEYKPGCYEFLAPIDFDANGGNLNGVQSKEGRTWIENIREFRFGDYVNFLFRIAISALVIISVVMIMVAGIEYMTVESLFGKSQAKARIKGAVGGLILALASYTILHTLNPKLLDMSALDNMEVASLAGGDPDPNDTTTASIGGKQCVMVESPWGAPSEKIANFKIKCSSNYSLTDIAKSFIGHTTYRFGAKGGKFPSNTTQCLIDGKAKDVKCKNDQGEMQRCGEFCPSDSLCLDCSGFVYEVLKCKGLNPKKYGSVNYFGDTCKKQKLTIISASYSGGDISIIYKDSSGVMRNYSLKEGDLIGAPKHHVAMYIGNGKFIDSQPGRKSKNTAVKIRNFMNVYNAQMKKEEKDRWLKYVLPLGNLKDC